MWTARQTGTHGRGRRGLHADAGRGGVSSPVTSIANEWRAAAGPDHAGPFLQAVSLSPGPFRLLRHTAANTERAPEQANDARFGHF